MTSDQAQHDCREILHHSWYAFFGRFGNLRPVQIDAIPPIVAGKNVLVGAATASGKTEAVVAPLVERILAARHKNPEIRLLIISPTRALCNDLFRRLEGPVQTCRLKIDLKTGDSPTLKLNDPAQVLITTPESLDSMLSRRPKILQHVSSMMIDELHMMDNIARGDQLRCLIERLQRVVKEPLQICAASATLADAPRIASRFLGPDAVLVSPRAETKVHRHIEATVVPASTPAQITFAIETLFTEAPSRKIIVFANARGMVEQIVGDLNGRERLRGHVFAHHGSLSRSVRLHAETSFLNAPAAICVATMTLELGVDIGSVDRVVLVGVPPDVSSLLQRVGRSNRKESTTHLLCLYDSGFDRMRFEHLLHCAVRSELFEDFIPFRPSIIAQQALSLVFQNPKNWIAPEALHSRLPRDAAERWTVKHCKAILDHMTEQGYFHRIDHGRYVADERSKKMFEYGLLHGNIEDSSEIEIYDEMTGQLIGRAALNKDDEKRLREGSDVNLSLAGKKRQVLRIRENRAFVDTSDGSDQSLFVARSAPRYSFGLARSLAHSIGYAPDSFIIEPRDPGQFMLGHFLGSTWGQLLKFVLRKQKLLGRQCTPFFADITGPLPEMDKFFGSPLQIQDTLDKAIAANNAIFARMLDAGPFRSCLPDEILNAWIHDALNIPDFIETLMKAQFYQGSVIPEQ